jgi:hypothetical protein
VYNDSGQSSFGYVPEHGRKGVDGEENDKSRDDSGKWRADTSLGLDRRPREGPCGRVGAEKWTCNITISPIRVRN